MVHNNTYNVNGMYLYTNLKVHASRDTQCMGSSGRSLIVAEVGLFPTCTKVYGHT